MSSTTTVFPSPQSPFHPLPHTKIAIPRTPLTEASLAFLTAHTSPATTNHCLRSAAFALLLLQRLPNFASDSLDTEALVISILLHDMGWAITKSLLSTDKRFEVDGANIARDFLSGSSSSSSSYNQREDAKETNPHRLQLIWDTIALHTTGSIALHKQPEVALAHLGISADFMGPYFPATPGSEVGAVIGVEEHREIVRAFPREGFKDGLVEILCGLCREKPETTFDNFVAGFGVAFGVDGKGKGEGREEFRRRWEEGVDVVPVLFGGLERCEEFEG